MDAGSPGIVTLTATAPAPRNALLAGATGLTGGTLLQLLLECGDYARVHALTRRVLPLDHPRLANRVVRLSELDRRLPGVRADDAFCCVGAAGGPAATAQELQAVDVGLVLAFATAARSAGATRLVVISALGADAASSNPFLRAKGEMEAALRGLDFKSLDIVRPGAVLGVRDGAGVGGLLGQGLRVLTNPLRVGRLAPTRALPSANIAAAMLAAARTGRRGVTLYSGQALEDLAAGKRRLA